MYTAQQLENILFIDIETASVTEDFDGLPERMRELWEKRATLLNKREDAEMAPDEWFTERAAVFAEFGRVVCISAGYIKYVGEKPTFRVKSYFGEDERQLLLEFTQMLDRWMTPPTRQMCAHNGKEFDFPYLGRRYLIHGLPMPKALVEIQVRKPWEQRVIDTMVLWKFGEYRNFTSLDLMTAVLDIPSPKDDIDGSKVGQVYWKEKDYQRIAVYCEKDVLATAQVLLRISREPLIRPEDVETV